MKRTRAYKPDVILLNVCEYLKDIKRMDTASNIAKQINIAPKTAQKYLIMGVNLGILMSDELYKVGTDGHCMAYWLNPKYLEIFNSIV